MHKVFYASPSENLVVSAPIPHRPQIPPITKNRKRVGFGWIRGDLLNFQPIL